MTLERAYSGLRPRIAAVLLAAGASKRLGRPKQLVRIDGMSLVRRAAEAALAAGCAPLIVVLGAHAEAVEQELRSLATSCVRNEGFAEGIASSIRCGMDVVGELGPACEGALVLLTDQPGVDAALLRRMRARFSDGGGRRIVACSYQGCLGAPALFPAVLFAELAALRGDRGAGALLERHRAEVLELSFPEGALDIDTPDDLALSLARP